MNIEYDVRKILLIIDKKQVTIFFIRLLMTSYS